MTYQTLSDVNTSKGLHMVLVYANNVTNGLFSSLLLFAVFFIVMVASYSSQKRTEGRSNLASSFATAGFFTALVSSIMLLFDGLTNVFTVAVTFTVAIIGALWLLTSSKD